MAVGLGLLGLSPDVFWRMTPREFEAAVAGRMGGSGREAPMAANELGKLIAQFPDR
jgi:uncharacterized phage protein (TIGR02216 family)